MNPRSLTALAQLFMAGSLFAQTGAGDRPVPGPFSTRSPVLAQHGMAATSQPLASQVAIDVLKAGGSAVDAAIAANAALGLMEPTGCGIGGDLFAIVWDPESKQLHGLNASGRSPLGLDLEGLKKRLGEREEIPLFGPLPISVPGCVSGWGELHARFGKLEWKALLAPAIDYARKGFPVTDVIAHDWAMNLRRFAENRADLGDLADIERVYTIDGRAPRAGEVFENPELARTLERIAAGGASALYTGPLAQAMVRTFERAGCALTARDLAEHRAVWVEPVSIRYRNVDVYELPPNGQGIAALQMLAMLEGFDLHALGHNSPAYLHAQVEAKKLAFADRARFYADPAFADIPLQGLLSPEYAAEQRKRIDVQHAALTDAPGNPRLEQGDTVYLTVADSAGMMVSLIQSNYVGMGSGLVPDGLGFVLQDRGALFTLEEGHPNVYAPGKRPFHTIIPAFAMRDRKPWLAFGVMGGAMQPQGHVQILCNLIDFGMNVQQAGDAARYNHTGSSQPTGSVMTDGGVVHLEGGIGAEVREALGKLGHRIETAGSYGGYQAILWDAEQGVYHGASEMRKDGQVAGY
jgi:gamma-glutamyltranspeptidase/glutathione hydrolase